MTARLSGPGGKLFLLPVPVIILFIAGSASRKNAEARYPPANKNFLLTGIVKSDTVPGTRRGKTITGTVTDNESFKTTNFYTPNGDLTVITTSDQEQLRTGRTLTGTVIAEPAGKNQKEKDDNLKELMKTHLLVGGTTVALTGLEHLFHYSGNRNENDQFHISLTDPGERNSQTLGWEIARDPVLTYPGDDQAPPSMFMTENLALGENIISVHTPPREDAQFKESDHFSLSDSRGNNFPVVPLAMSGATAVIKIPDGAAIGLITIHRSREGRDPDEASFHYADLELSSPNTNLKKGEKSFIMVRVNPGDNPADNPVPEFQVVLSNLNPSIVAMEGGNLQTVGFPAANESWSIQRGIEGIVPGGFSVNASLLQDLNTSNAPFLPEKEVLDDPQTFNRWVEALKTDLLNYANAQGNDTVGRNTRENSMRARTNLRNCNNPSDLNACKQMADELLLPLQVPKGAATCWLSSYEAMKAAVSGLEDKVTGKESAIDWPLIRNGLYLAGNMGDELNDPQLSGDADKIRERLPLSYRDEVSPANLEEVNRDLHDLIGRCDEKIRSGKKSYLKYARNDLILATTRLAAGTFPRKPLLLAAMTAYNFDTKPKLYSPEDKDHKKPLPNPYHLVDPNCDTADEFQYTNSTNQDVIGTLFIQNNGKCYVFAEVAVFKWRPGLKKNPEGTTKEKQKGNETPPKKLPVPSFGYSVMKTPGGSVNAFKIGRGMTIWVIISCEGDNGPCDFRRSFSVTTDKVAVKPGAEPPRLTVDPPNPVGKLDPYSTLGNRCISKDSVYYSITNRDVKDTMVVHFKAVSECVCYYEAYVDLQFSSDESGEAKQPKTGLNKLGQDYNGTGEIAKGNNKPGKSSEGIELIQVVPPGKTLYLKGRCPEQLEKAGPCKGSVVVTGITYRAIKK